MSTLKAGPRLPIRMQGVTVNIEMTRTAWGYSGAMLMGLVSGGLALWATRLAGVELTGIAILALSLVYGCGLAGGLLVAVLTRPRRG